jgi:CO dehydrogenase maturation factor
MRISVCGKGGSGKSTITALLAVSFIKLGYRVLVIDSDESNSGLYRKLGFDEAPEAIIEIAGGRQGIKSRAEKFKVGGNNYKPDILEAVSLKINDIPAKNIAHSERLSFVQVGKINQALEGCACPMGVLNREFLGKLDLDKNDIVIVDTEAGLEHFGRGVESNIDAIVIIVDPSSESVDFAKKAYELSKSLDINTIRIILNKVNSISTAEKLSARLKGKGLEPLVSVPSDELIFNSELDGKRIASKSAIKEISVLSENLIKEDELRNG